MVPVKLFAYNDSLVRCVKAVPLTPHADGSDPAVQQIHLSTSVTRVEGRSKQSPAARLFCACAPAC